MREGERDVVQSNAPRRSTHSLTCQINLLRDDAAGRGKGEGQRRQGRGVVSRGAAKQASLKQAICTGRRRKLIRSGFISNISFIRKGKDSLGCTSSYYHNLRAQYHIRHIQVPKSEALASSVRSNPDCPETQAGSAMYRRGLWRDLAADFPCGVTDFFWVVRTFPMVVRTAERPIGNSVRPFGSPVPKPRSGPPDLDRTKQ